MNELRKVAQRILDHVGDYYDGEPGNRRVGCTQCCDTQLQVGDLRALAAALAAPRAPEGPPDAADLGQFRRIFGNDPNEAKMAYEAMRDEVEDMTKYGSAVSDALALIRRALAMRDYGDKPDIWDQVWRDIEDAARRLGNALAVGSELGGVSRALPEPTPEYAIAGTFQQFRQWLRAKRRPESAIRYLSSGEALRGLPQGGVLWRIGLWRDHPHVDGILEYAAILGMEMRDA